MIYRILAFFLGFLTIAVGVLAGLALLQANYLALGWLTLAALVLGILYAMYSGIAKQQDRR